MDTDEDDEGVVVADLVVDLGLLQQTTGSLGMLIEEFTNASEIVDDGASYLGDNALQSELGSFVSDWKVHRQDLLKSMQAVYTMTHSSYQAYTTADDKLAQDIKQSMKSSSSTQIGHR